MLLIYLRGTLSHARSNYVQSGIANCMVSRQMDTGAKCAVVMSLLILREARNSVREISHGFSEVPSISLTGSF
jgi:hypothetical protein